MAETWYIALRTQGLPRLFMMILGWPLTFLQQGQIYHLYGENVEKSFSQYMY